MCLCPQFCLTYPAPGGQPHFQNISSNPSCMLVAGLDGDTPEVCPCHHLSLCWQGQQGTAWDTFLWQLGGHWDSFQEFILLKARPVSLIVSCVLTPPPSGLWQRRCVVRLLCLCRRPPSPPFLGHHLYLLHHMPSIFLPNSSLRCPCRSHCLSSGQWPLWRLTACCFLPLWSLLFLSAPSELRQSPFISSDNPHWSLRQGLWIWRFALACCLLFLFLRCWEHC